MYSANVHDHLVPLAAKKPSSVLLPKSILLRPLQGFRYLIGHLSFVSQEDVWKDLVGAGNVRVNQET